MFIVKMTSSTHPNFTFKCTSKTIEEATEQAFLALKNLGGFHIVYEVSEVIFI